jgi:hypothetical protein
MYSDYATDWTVWSWTPERGKRFFTSHDNVQTGSGSLLSPFFNDYGVIFRGGGGGGVN